MKKFLFALMLATSAMALIATDADAKRLGGGGSFGKQSQNLSRPAPMQAPSQQFNQPRPSAPAAVPPAIAPKPASPLRGMLGGALLGLGAGALLSHFGFGGAMGGMFGSILMFGLLAAAAFFLIRMFSNKNRGDAGPGSSGSYNPATNANAYARQADARVEPATPSLQPSMYGAAAGGAASGAASGAAYGQANGPATQWGIPADFDVPGFLRNSKTYFIRLQAAWDKADIDDIREFTSSEMFGELRLQIQERGASANNTDVVSLNAELVGIETSAATYLASVKFSGMIKEAVDAPATPFNEVWNLSKPTDGHGGWILSGIQQVS